MTERAKAICPRGPEGRYREGWTWLPVLSWLSRVEGLSVLDWVIYGVLANASKPGHDSVTIRVGTIAARAGLSERSTQRQIAALEHAGLIVVDRCRHGRGQPSTYTFLWHPAQDSVPADSAGTESPHREKGDNQSPTEQTMGDSQSSTSRLPVTHLPTISHHSVEFLSRAIEVERDATSADAPAAELPLAPTPSELSREGEPRAGEGEPRKSNRKTRERDELTEQLRKDWCDLHNEVHRIGCTMPSPKDAGDLAKLCRADSQRYAVSPRGLGRALMYAHLTSPGRKSFSPKWIALDPAQAMRGREFQTQLDVERKLDAAVEVQPSAADEKQTTIAEVVA